jgi:DNA-dependent protein kinase catalytic subunit
MFIEAKEKDAIHKNKQIKDCIPNYFIRNKLLKIAMGAEAFLTLRTEFAKTLAVSSLFGYILGVGDRHLENLLIDYKTGGIVQIDFGICFGIAQSLLPVPELIPFRLSPQLIGVLQPLDGTGLLRHYMVQVMTCLRGEEGLQTLANALQVYIDDPVVDWLSGKDLKGETDQEPRRRVQSCIRKLKGVDASQIMVEDIKLNKSVRDGKSVKSLEGMIKRACEGSNMYIDNEGYIENGDIYVSVEKQVDSLINLAVDPNITVRQWVGLNLWI